MKEISRFELIPSSPNTSVALAAAAANDWVGIAWDLLEQHLAFVLRLALCFDFCCGSFKLPRFNLPPETNFKALNGQKDMCTGGLLLH